jgi:hypothetical protein
MAWEASRSSYKSSEADAARIRTEETAKLLPAWIRQENLQEPQNPERPDMSRTAYVLCMIGIGLLFIFVLLADRWYQSSLVKYPPDRPLIQQEKDQCDESARKGWPQSPYCKYR